MAARKGPATRPAKAKPAAGSGARRPPLLTPARQRELVGALFVALAVLTVVGFVTPQGSLIQPWTDVLVWLFGWGAYAVPLGLGAIGAWLIVDSLDGAGDVRWERPLAGAALFLALLGLLQLAALRLGDGRSSDMVAAGGGGGGWVGHAIGTAFATGFGPAGAVLALMGVVLVAWTVMMGHTLREAGAGVAAAGRGLTARARAALSPRRGSPPPGPPAPAPAPGAVAAGSSPPEAAPARPAAPVATDALGRTPAAPPPAPAAQARPAWRLPTLDEILEPLPEAAQVADDSQATARLIETTLGEFGIPVSVVEINRGPTVTQFGLEPGYIEKAGLRSRVKVSRIVALQNDLALALAASPLRILAPVPGRPYVGVEVPNSASTMVTLRSVVESEPFRRLAAKGGLPIALGRDTSGHPAAADLTGMPHLLIAGATGSGKSVAINTLISSLLMTHTPDTLRLLLVDPKRVELAQFAGLPHLAAPVVVDVERVVGLLQWAVREMDRRYKTFAEAGARNLAAFNARQAGRGEPPLPYLVLVIDELADLMMVAPEEAERLITRLAQLARATGIHLVLATQRPSVDVVTGLIKANFPSRIAFAVSSSIDSRVILDTVGADKLLGRGDMLYMASDSSKLQRLQGCFVSDIEIERLTRFWKTFYRPAAPAADTALTLGLPPGPASQPELWADLDALEAESAEDERDPLYEEAVALVRAHRTASTSFLQRKLRVGYSRAARLLDELEAEGVVGEAQGNHPREVLPPPEPDEDPDQAGWDLDEAEGPDAGAGPVRPWLAR